MHDQALDWHLASTAGDIPGLCWKEGVAGRFELKTVELCSPHSGGCAHTRAMFYSLQSVHRYPTVPNPRTRNGYTLPQDQGQNWSANL